MTPRTDEYEHDNDNLSAVDDDDDDDDEGLKEDMAALARACMIAGDEIPTQKDPLLAAGDALVPVPVPVPVNVTADLDSDSDSDDGRSDLECLRRVQSLYQPLDSLPPMTAMATTTLYDAGEDDDCEDDFETVRAIFKRFSAYDVGGMEKLAEGDQALSLSGEQVIANYSTSYKSDTGELCPVSQDPSGSISYKSDAGEMCPLSQDPDGSISYKSDTGELCPVSQDPNKDGNLLTKHCGLVESNKTDACASSKLPQKRSSFPPSAQAFIDAIKKNRALQRLLRSKLIEIEAKIEENKKLRDKVKLLKDFQVSCIRRTGNALSLKKDPRVQLISTKKSFVPNNSKSHNKKVSAMCYGPAENSRVANYKMVLERFPLSLDRKKWSNVERGSLSKGIKQQFQETVLQISVDRMSSECSFGDADDMDSIVASVKDLEITPEMTKEFLPKVNWDRLASMYVTGRTGAECESRWLNCENPLINHGPWTGEEDRSLLIIVQEKKDIRNWFDIAESLGTNRTPFQCLARFQRSLNPSMLNSEWTEEEDAQLCSAVAYFGESDWQSVASVLERRTGTQCSNRWKKSLCPVRKGSFTPEEDERLTVAVMLFGRKWNLIAKFVPGRIQSQCRDRYLNSLDPSLKWGGWTEEEDSRLEAAIAKHGYYWSKVAEEVPPRTDSQCRKRWKVLCPEQVPLLQEARKRQKSLLASNFVDRESERPALTLNDFLPLQMVAPPSDVGAANLYRKRQQKSSNVPKRGRSKKHEKEASLCPEEVQDVVLKKERPKRRGKKAPLCPEEVQDIVPKKQRPKRHAKKAPLCPQEVQDIVVYSDKVNVCRGGVPFIAFSNVPKKMRSKRRAKKAQIHHEEVEDIACCDKVKTCIEISESQDGDNITLACFLHNKSKKRRAKFIESVSQASFSSRATVVHKQVENQIPSGEQDRLSLSLSCGTGGNKDLPMQKNVASRRQVRKPEGAKAVRKPEDANNLTGDDNDMTLACLMRRNKSKKWSQATEGRCARSSSKLKKGSVLVGEVHYGNKPTIIADGSGPSMSKLVEEETVLLHGGVAEPTNINAEENDDLLASFLQNKRQQRRHNISKGIC